MSNGSRAPSAQAIQSLRSVSMLLQTGNFSQALPLLEKLAQSEPQVVEVHRLLGGALQAIGNLDGAERALRAAVALDPRSVPAQLALAELLAHVGKDALAESAFRAALGVLPNHARAALGLARILLRKGSANDAAHLLAPFAAASASAELLNEFGNALAAAQRMNEAIAAYQQAALAAPTVGLIHLNLAGALESMGRHAEAAGSAQRAIDSGGDIAPAWCVLGCARVGESKFDEAEHAFRESIKRQPDFVDAQRELAQLIWMRSEDATAASAELNQALQRFPTASGLYVVKSTLLSNVGDDEGALSVLATAANRDDAGVTLLMAASDAAMSSNSELALTYARRAVALQPENIAALRALGIALLAAGRAEEALQLAQRGMLARPLDQHLIATQATAWRLLGDARYASLCNYAELVRTWTIDTPTGWTDLPSYLEDLQTSLRNLHRLRTHPVGQSLRHGTQTTENLLLSNDPAIRAIPVAIDGPIRRHIAAIGLGEGILRARNTGNYRLHGLWSVRLRPGGYHTNHVHPEGWLSSACYIDVPAAVEKNGHEGWLKFGEPGMPTQPPLSPEFFVQPKPGLLALFPSYFWHGTVPFSGADTRLSIAFDVVPA